MELTNETKKVIMKANFAGLSNVRALSDDELAGVTGGGRGCHARGCNGELVKIKENSMAKTFSCNTCKRVVVEATSMWAWFISIPPRK